MPWRSEIEDVYARGLEKAVYIEGCKRFGEGCLYMQELWNRLFIYARALEKAVYIFKRSRKGCLYMQEL